MSNIYIEILFYSVLALLIYIPLCALVGLWGERRRLGFWLSFGLAFVTSPLVGFLIVWRWDKT